MVLTDHARARMQQRGISAAALDALLDFGRARPAGNGCEIVFFDKKARRRLAVGSGPGSEKRSATTISHLTPNFRSYAILGSDGKVITVGHRTRRISRYR